MAEDRKLFDDALYHERLADLHDDTLERSAALRQSLADHLKGGQPLTKWFPPFLIAAHSGDMVGSDVAGAVLDLLASRGTTKAAQKSLIDEVQGIVALYRTRERNSLLRPNGKVVPLPEDRGEAAVKEVQPVTKAEALPLVQPPPAPRHKAILQWGIWVLAAFGAVELIHHAMTLIQG